jgi:class 3 adenylate cyclase
VTLSFDDLVAEGLYDPDAPDAETRRVLLERALAVGAGLDEIRHACEEGWIHVVPTRVAILGGPPTLSVEEAAARAGIAPEFATRLWHTLRLDQRGYRECVDDDVAIFELYAGALSMFGEEETLQIASVQAAAMSMMADAEVAQVRALLEAPQRGVGADNVAVGDMWVEFVRDFLAVVERGMARLHRHQILATGRRYTLWGAPTEESTADVVVGFADLVGFTALGQMLEPRQVDALLRTFEARAAGTATSAGTRLVKLIGDEAMFVAGTADDALTIARALVDDPALPELRVGIAAGLVTTRGGDVFGGPVNLAARLVATAQPGEILVDSVAAERAGASLALHPRGSRDLPGFDEAIEVYVFDSA